MRKILIALFLGILAGCSSPSNARRTLEDAGYEDIRITGYRPFSCGEDDFTSTGFVAKNVKGKNVDGVVCCGIVKNCTIRH